MSQYTAKVAERMALVAISTQGFGGAWNSCEYLKSMIETSTFAQVYVDTVMQYGLDNLVKGLDTHLG